MRHGVDKGAHRRQGLAVVGARCRDEEHEALVARRQADVDLRVQRPWQRRAERHGLAVVVCHGGCSIA